MPHSMTAYAHSVEKTPWGEISCELRSVNHRYLEISPRLAEELRHLEPEVRDVIGKRIKRGRVDCTMRFQQQAQELAGLELDTKQARLVLAAGEQLRDLSVDLRPLRAIDVLRWPGVVQAGQVDAEQLSTLTMATLNKALDEFVVVRQREGQRLVALLQQRRTQMVEILGRVREMLPGSYAAFRERIESRMGEVREQMDPARLEQEMVIYIQRADVAEEVDRLQVHLDEVYSVLEKDQPMGR
ncbi:MAG: YicC/YloC family endoribonuclease, partial [Saprospiraceae bacterium]|nr:YicC/YloC family endoribonuclease [Saprospiraceae bacterium]